MENRSNIYSKISASACANSVKNGIGIVISFKESSSWFFRETGSLDPVVVRHWLLFQAVPRFRKDVLVMISAEMSV